MYKTKIIISHGVAANRLDLIHSYIQCNSVSRSAKLSMCKASQIFAINCLNSAHIYDTVVRIDRENF